MYVGAGLAGLPAKGVLTGESFTIFRNWLSLEGAVPPGSARPQTSKHPKRIVNTESDLELSTQTL